MHPHIQKLLKCIELEEKEQAERYRLDQQHTFKTLKAEGLALHPIIVTRKNFGYAEYPEISFRLSFPPEANMFKDGAAIECFITGEEPVKGVLLSLDGLNGEFRLFAPDFPDWIEDNGVGIKLAPDQRTTTIMKTVLNNLENNKPLFALFQQLHDVVSKEQYNKDAKIRKTLSDCISVVETREIQLVKTNSIFNQKYDCAVPCDEEIYRVIFRNSNR